MSPVGTSSADCCHQTYHIHNTSCHQVSKQADKCLTEQVNSSVKEPNKFHNYETKKITRKASDAAEYIELFGSSIRDCHA